MSSKSWSPAGQVSIHFRNASSLAESAVIRRHLLAGHDRDRRLAGYSWQRHMMR